MKFTRIFGLFTLFACCTTAKMTSSKFEGASGYCTPNGVYMAIDVNKMLHKPDRFLLEVRGENRDIFNARIARGDMPACMPKTEGQVTVFNFTFGDCPTEPKILNNGTTIEYKYTIRALIDGRDINFNKHVIFRANREALTVACEVDAQAQSTHDFIPDVASQMAEIENTTVDSNLVTRLFLDSKLKSPVSSIPVPLGEWIYSSVAFDGATPNVFIAPRECTAVTGTSSQVYKLIDDGCPADPKTEIMIAETLSLKRYVFRFESFSFSNQLGIPIAISCSANSTPIRDDADKAVKEFESDADERMPIKINFEQVTPDSLNA